MGDGGSGKKVGNSLLALSSAAVIAVYAAGYVRTRAAADRFAQQTEARVRPLVTKSGTAPSSTEPVAVAAAAPTTAPRVVDAKNATDPKPRRRISGSNEIAAPPKTAYPALSTKHPARNTEHPAPNTEHSAPSTEHPAPNTEHSAPNTEHSAPSTEHSAPNTEHPAPNTEHPALSTEHPAPQYKDGTYFGWGTSRHGDIQAQVVIENGRIASATIAQCLTRYSCSVIAKLPPQVAERQSPEVDYVSGATQSADAFYYAVVEALAKAK